nr:PREDICTED: uncharacterized protein LOC104328383 [Opisthocomus hoazin]
MILLTDMQLDFMPLVTTLWTQPYSQFSVHLTVYLSSSILHQLACEEVAGDSVKRLTKVNRNNIHSSPLIRGASHLITEGYQDPELHQLVVTTAKPNASFLIFDQFLFMSLKINGGNSDPDLDFAANWTSKFQVKQSEKNQCLKACDGNKKEHIYLNVKHSTSSKKQMMRRQRTEENKNKDSPVSCATCWIIAVILGILFLASLGTTVGFIIKGCPCPHCPEKWIAHRGSCYSFSKERKDWYSSQQSCRAQGAHLLVISDTSEMDLFQMMHTKLHWIGLRNGTDGDWAWEEGSKLSGKKVQSNSPVQNCAVLLEGAIHASSCEVLAPWICKKSLR